MVTAVRQGGVGGTGVDVQRVRAGAWLYRQGLRERPAPAVSASTARRGANGSAGKRVAGIGGPSLPQPVCAPWPCGRFSATDPLCRAAPRDFCFIH